MSSNFIKKRPELLFMLSTITFLAAFSTASSEESAPYPRISREAFEARLPFFDPCPGVPLDAHIVREWDEDTSIRWKFVFRGGQ